ncbi:probable cytochrome P450 6a14 [Apis florea]|uniref:probable cytochrome P450 6a14 n=1 Tax=Apis florea TaxID=7463 RepID=UPI0012FF3233|nr:probable cytochrome P450 6a14 [Apis florea]
MYINLEIFCGIVITLIAFYCYLTSNNNFWKNRGISGPKPMLGFGNMKKVIFGEESLVQFLTKMYHEYKNESMIGIFKLKTPALIIKDPDLIKTVLIKDFSKFMNRGLLPIISTEPISQHLFALEAKRWQPLRKHLTSGFTSNKLKGMFYLIHECSQQLVNYVDILIRKEESINVREVAARFTTDVVGSCGFGVDMNSLSEKESEFRRLGKSIFDTNVYKIIIDRIRELTPQFYNLLLYILPLDKISPNILKLTKETIEYRIKNDIFRPDFINILLELKKHPEKIDLEITDELLAAQVFIFFTAGFETSSTMLSNALYELALNPDVQNKLREEIKEFESKNDEEWKHETVKKMNYLEKIFQETLRKYPSVPFLNREIIEDYTFESNKVTVPKGLKIWIPTYAIHNDPDIYPDPEKFDPERFSEDNIKQRHPMYFLPFGHGPRNCIGIRFAVYQVKIGLINIIRNFKLDVCDKTLIPYKLHPRGLILIPLTDVTNEFLAAQAFIFFIAGFETSSTTISNALYELALNPDIQDKLRKEIKEFEEKNDGDWKYETIKEMEYLEKIFQETLRKYPSLPFLNREIIDDYTIGNNKVTLPKGLKIWIPTYAIHNDPDIYPDPEKFDPERFSEDNIKQRHPMHFLPFGHGPRNCIGSRFAVYQVKIGLIEILRNFKLDVCDKTLIPYKFHPRALLLSPFTDIYLKITRLTDYITNELLAAQTFIFFVAGFETSSTTISNALYELALNPDIQDKLRKEIKEFEEKNDGDWKYETIKEMEYLGKVFQETLRKYPSLPFLNREIIDDYTFESNKVTLPKGLKIWIPIYAIHHDPDIYPDPEKFDPERFSEDKIKQRHPMHFSPFGHGPRNCIGARFAVYQVKIGLIKILRNFKLDVCDKTLIPYKFHPRALLLSPFTDIYLKITRLTD